MEFLRPNLEKDFEFFMKNIGKLDPIEFCGLAKVLGVRTLRGLDEIGLTTDQLKEKTEEELAQIQEDLMIPLDVVFEQMMERFLSLPRKRRKEINQILKDAKRGK